MRDGFKHAYKHRDTHTQQNIMQLLCIMTLDLKQLQHREDLPKSRVARFLAQRETRASVCVSVLYRSVASCFIHNNLCAIVFGHHFVYIVFGFGFAGGIDVANR